MTSVSALLKIRPTTVVLPTGWRLDVRGFTLQAASLTQVLGPNGSGKSLFLKAIAGLARMPPKTVFLNGKDIGGWSPDRRARAGVRYVPQTRPLFDTLTIAENYELARRWSAARPKRPTLETSRLSSILARTAEKAGNLSGGERQLLAVHLAGLSSARLLILDEPFAFLSDESATFLTSYIQKLAQFGVAVVVVDHTGLFQPMVPAERYQIADGVFQRA